jgi:hypothetical protein
MIFEFADGHKETLFAVRRRRPRTMRLTMASVPGSQFQRVAPQPKSLWWWTRQSLPCGWAPRTVSFTSTPVRTASASKRTKSKCTTAPRSTAYCECTFKNKNKLLNLFLIFIQLFGKSGVRLAGQRGHCHLHSRRKYANLSFIFDGTLIFFKQTTNGTQLSRITSRWALQRCPSPKWCASEVAPIFGAPATTTCAS